MVGSVSVISPMPPQMPAIFLFVRERYNFFTSHLRKGFLDLNVLTQLYTKAHRKQFRYGNAINLQLLFSASA
jgi:hypothetical protein